MVDRRENAHGVFHWALGARLSLPVWTLFKEVRGSRGVLADDQEGLDGSIATTILASEIVGVVEPIIVVPSEVWTESNGTPNLASGSPHQLQRRASKDG